MLHPLTIDLVLDDLSLDTDWQSLSQNWAAVYTHFGNQRYGQDPPLSPPLIQGAMPKCH